MASNHTPRWSLVVPLVAIVALVAGFALPPHPVLVPALAVALGGAVLAGVHHADVVGHRVGEPFGTLVLALAVTVIEVGLLVSLMLAGGPDAAALPRDTVFAVIMVVCNGIMGTCLLVGATAHGEQDFKVEGAAAALAVLIALSTLTLVVPVFTESAPGPAFSVPQLAFAGVASLVLYAGFVFVQTIRHREYFVAPGKVAPADEVEERPTGRAATISAGLMLVSLVAVVGLAKTLSPAIEAAVVGAGAPKAVVGITIAMLVLMPESWSAIRASRANRLQTSLNLALGSAIASIGLTIPAVAAVSVVLDIPLLLGLGPLEIVLLVLTYVLSLLTLSTGRTNVLQGIVHLVIFAAFLFLALFP